MEKIKNKVVVIEFFLVLLLILIINIVKKDDQISIIERRRLSQFPKFSIENLFNGKYFKSIDNYTIDQFVKRDNLKEVKYWFSVNIFRNQDNNKMFVKNGSIYKMEYPLKLVSIDESSRKIKSLCENQLKDMTNIYYSVIPDKTYYLKDNHLCMDYSMIENIMNTNIKNAKYIDIKDQLTKEDFYNTDLHWKQENLEKVANYIKLNMGLTQNAKYEEKVVGEYYGTYYGQVGTKIEVDTIKYLTNEEIENVIVKNYENNQQSEVYDFDKYKKSSDKYDIFLSGPCSLMTIENENAKTDKELLLFRDSFGSSIAPLFIENYRKITLIDLRYMNSKLLYEYIDFSDQDVLFLYSGIMLNQNIFK